MRNCGIVHIFFFTKHACGVQKRKREAVFVPLCPMLVCVRAQFCYINREALCKLQPGSYFYPEVAAFRPASRRRYIGEHLGIFYQLARAPRLLCILGTRSFCIRGRRHKEKPLSTEPACALVHKPCTWLRAVAFKCCRHNGSFLSRLPPHCCTLGGANYPNRHRRRRAPLRFFGRRSLADRHIITGCMSQPPRASF